MAFAELWLPVLGAGICMAWAIGAWYGDNKILAIWLIFGGSVCLGLLATLQIQSHLSAQQSPERLNPAERVMAETQRAFVVYKGIAVHRIVNEKGETIARRLNLFWENAGATPTRNMISQFGFHAFTGPMPDGFDFPDKEDFTRITIGPRQTVEMGDMDIPIEIVRMAQAGKARIYVWGWADYSDIFENTRRHRTEICAEATVNDPDAQDGAMTFIPCKRHNGTDGETLKQPRPYPPPS